MTDDSKTMPMNGADITTLERLAVQIKRDCGVVRGLNISACLSIADIIERAIGAPLSWPSREAGAQEADRLFPGDPSMRHAFNWGVKWAVEQYVILAAPTERKEPT